MDEIRKILVAVGFSDYSEGIFNYAAMLARAFDAKLLVANVINERDVESISRIAEMGYNLEPDHYVKELKAERVAQLDEIIKKSGFPADAVRALFKVGNPIHELLKIILQEDIDLVVMGVKGRTDLEHILVGSVAEKIFRRSPVTVVSYRDEKSAERLKKRIHM